MACSSFVNFEMNNPALFDELKKIGVIFQNNGSSCKLSSGETYKFINQEEDGVPYLGFDTNYMIGMFLEYFLGCGNTNFCYNFMKLLTEHAFFESNYDFESNPFDENEIYDASFYKQFRIASKLTAFEGTIIDAFVESFESEDGEITVLRATVKNNTMNICEVEFDISDMEEFDDDDDFDIDDMVMPGYMGPDQGFEFYWNLLDDESQADCTTTKSWIDGQWVNQ